MTKEFIVDNQFIPILVDKYSDMLIRIAYTSLKHMKDAEDVTQDVFLKLLRHDTPFESEAHLKAWLIRVTINRCHDLRRSAWFKRTVPLVEAPTIAVEDQRVMDELWLLPVGDRQVIYLYYYEGYTLREIANLLHKSINTISSRLQRARKKLKTILVEDGDFS